MTDLRLKPNETPRICGHRGDMRHSPENTLAAMRRAHQQGAGACEIDIRLTADGHLVLIHDATVDRTTDGSGAISDMTIAEVEALDAGSWFDPAFAGEPVPLLSQAMDLAKELGLVLRVELKDWHRDDVLFPTLSNLLAAWNEPPVVICSFDHRQLLEFKQIMPQVRTMGITHGRAVDMVALAKSARLDGLSVQTPAMDDSDIRALREAGLAISCYCPMNEVAPGGLSSVDKLRHWAAGGLIDMITVDDVAWMLAKLNSYGPDQSVELTDSR